MKLCNLQEAHGRGAKLKGTDLTLAAAERSVFTDADFSGARLSWSKFDLANLAGSRFERAVIEETTLHGADMKQTRLNDAQMISTGYHLTQFYGATWTDGKLCKKGSVGFCQK